MTASRRPHSLSPSTIAHRVAGHEFISHTNAAMTMKSIYDDHEQMLQDQGLEVVVVPYRPAPHDKNHSSRSTITNNHNANALIKNRNPGTNDSSSTSVETTETNISTAEQESSSPEFMTAHPSRQLVTPRSQLAMVEAVCHNQDNGNKSLLHPIAPRTPERDAQLQRQHTTSSRAAQSTAAPNNNAQPNSQNAKPHNSTNKSPSKKRNRKLSYLQLAKLGYQELVHAIIRPPRSHYPLESLGPDSFSFCNVQFKRRDFSVMNERGMRIVCSLWSCKEWNLDLGNSHGREINRQESTEECYTGRFILDYWDESKERGRMYLQLNEDALQDVSNGDYDEDSLEEEETVHDRNEAASTLNFGQCTITNNNRTKSNTSSNNTTTTTRQRHPVVIYLHGNSSSRLEVIPQLGHLLSLGVSVLSFDFTGSGHSDGDYVSLGYHEREDLDAIVKFLRNTRQVSSIALWGRSMGAATALMYASRDPTIACMVLDSPFTDLQRLIEEMVEKGRKHGVIVPNLILNVVMRLIKNSVKSTAGFSLRHISPISHAEKCFVPAMFVAGEHDDFIHKSHSILIHRKYAGDKNISIVDGDHNSPRPRFLQQSACLFLQSVMGLPADEELVVPTGINLLIPPWLMKNPRGLGSRDKAKDVLHSRQKRTKTWLPVKEQNEQKVHHRSQSEVLEFHQDKGLHRRRQTSPDFNVSRSNRNDDEVFSAREEEASAVLAAANPPDMNERQKDIQRSLFKMLGQSEP